jgi:restriction system protein
MNKKYRDKESPWNPRSPVKITPNEFETQVCNWLGACARIESIQVNHQEKIEGLSGDFAIDVLVRISIFGGAIISILVECKHQRRPVERDEVIILEGKLRDTTAHKGMIFSTSGFQKGAIDYATNHGIAAITVIRGDWLYETKAVGPTPPRPTWMALPAFAGQCLAATEKGISVRVILLNRLEAITDFLSA